MLSLQIIEGPSGRSEGRDSFTVGSSGATIGRTADCDWCLDDVSNQISRRHFRISVDHGQFHVHDDSTNGLFLNGSPTPIGRGNSEVINDGDRISLGEYVIAVSIEADPAVTPPGFPTGNETDLDLGPAPAIGNEVPATSTEDEIEPDETGELKHSDQMQISGNSDAFDAIQPVPVEPGLLGEQRRRRTEESTFGDPIQRAGNSLPGDPIVGSELKVPQNSPHDPRHFLGESGRSSLSPSPAGGNQNQQISPPPAAGLNVPLPAEKPSREEASSSSQLIPDGWQNGIEESDGDDSLDDLSARLEQSDIPVGGSPENAPPPLPEIAPPASVDAETDLAPIQAEESSVGGIIKSEPGLNDDGDFIEHARRALDQVMGEASSSADSAKLLSVIGTLATIVSTMTPLLMAAVSSRAQFKDALRLRQTLVRARENNPLKLGGDDQLALRRLVLNNEPGMLHGVAAVEEAFEQLADHQAAMVAALKPAIQTTLENLSPHSVEQDLPENKLELLALGGRKGKLWQVYEERFESLTGNGGRNIEQRFLNALAEEYDKALVKLNK